MLIKRLKLSNWKSYEDVEIHPHPSFNVITGLNGVGKTNLLDALYLACMTKSAFNSRDDYLVKHDGDYYRVEVDVDTNEDVKSLVIKYPKGGRKSIALNQKVYKKYADHLGKFPVVLIAPGDDQLLLGASAERRKYLDTTLGQIDPIYVDHLSLYNRILRQRNALLKEAESDRPISGMLDVYNEKLKDPAHYIFGKRAALTDEIIPFVVEAYESLSGGDVTPSLNYKSHLHEYGDIVSALKPIHSRDVAIGRTSRGVHKDDLELLIDNRPLKEYGSQGQRKSILLALKLAQYKYLHVELQNRPILLLDDIFDKLDKTRVNRLLDILSDPLFGQVFITDTDAERLENIFQTQNRQFNHYLVNPNSIKEGD